MPDKLQVVNAAALAFAAFSPMWGRTVGARGAKWWAILDLNQ